jgi:hypothetical protein
MELQWEFHILQAHTSWRHVPNHSCQSPTSKLHVTDRAALRDRILDETQDAEGAAHSVRRQIA